MRILLQSHAAAAGTVQFRSFRSAVASHRCSSAQVYDIFVDAHSEAVNCGLLTSRKTTLCTPDLEAVSLGT